MKCQNFDERLNEVLDRRMDPQDDFELVHHSIDCQKCCQILRVQSLMCEAVSQRDSSAEPSNTERNGTGNCISEKTSADGGSVCRAWLARVPFWATAASILWFIVFPFSEVPTTNPNELAKLSHPQSPAVSAANLSVDTAKVEKRPTETLSERQESPFPSPERTANEISKLVLSVNQIGTEANQYPAVVPLTNSVNVAFELIRKPFTKEKPQQGKKKSQTRLFNSLLSDRLV